METTLAVFAYVRDYVATNYIGPTLDEIAAATGFAHGTSVRRHLLRLEAMGLITRDRFKPRAIAITERGWQYRIPEPDRA